MLTLGIDDAGRGPLIGPMILAGVLIDKNGEAFLKKMKIRDSKVVLHNSRIALAKPIKETTLAFHIVKASPKLIDDSINSEINLNTLEAMKTAEVINKINFGKIRKEKIKVIVDCPSVNLTAWKAKLEEFVEFKDNLKIFCEHKADANHISAAAASILAKVTREEEVEKLKKLHGELGSGYPSDPTTKKFLEEHGRELREAGIFRKSWSTWKKMFPGSETGQKTLGDF